MLEGVAFFTHQGRTEISEYKDGNRFGKGTIYWKDGTIDNTLTANDSYYNRHPKKEITNNPELAFYSKDGKPLMAIEEDYEKFIK